MAASLTPELAVRNWQVSRVFYCDVLGFDLAYERPEEGFCFLNLGDASLMIDQIGEGRTFDQVEISAEARLGLGMNLQIQTDRLDEMRSKLSAINHPLYLPLEERWYRKGELEVGNRQFVVRDPDGYLLRFFEDLGARSLTPNE